MPKKLDYVHLHLHSEFSMLDGLGTVDEYVTRAVQLKQNALAITDHGNICGSPTFYHACRKANIEPVLGCELYYVPDAAKRPEKGKKDPGEKMRHHIGVLARGRTGYQVLAELSTATFRNFYHKPLLDRALVEALGKDAKHLTVLSGCAASTLSRAILDDKMDEAIEEVTWWREQFPHYYIELMNHSTDFDDKLNKGLIKLAKRYKIPWVITNDPHYAHEHDAPHHDALLAIQTAADIDDPERFRFSGKGYHLRSANAMRIAFKDLGPKVYEPGMANSIQIAKDCQLRIPEWETRTWHIPKFPGVDNAYKEVRKIARSEMRRRGWDTEEEYVERLEMELKVIKKVGISDFLLITLDIIRFAEEAGIRVGPGRGSVCGTLVGFLIGLHKIDPVKYDLLFERFLNPARPRMPDIDTDFGQARRFEVFEYITAKYGRENVMHICTYGHMRNKAAFQSLAAAYGIPFADRIRISKDLAPKGEEEEDYLPAEIRDNYPDLAAQLERLSGIKRAISTHPAGVIIADPSINIRKLIPELYIPSSQKWVAQYDLDAVEEMGLLKEDILGLRTLDTIQECVNLIHQSTGEWIEPDDWMPDDEPGDAEAYEILSGGNTTGVFQMEGGTNALGIQAIKCTCFEDIVSCTSLYRTGPIMAGYPEQFLNNRKAGKKKIKWAHPMLKPILEDTWGVILFQEQVMSISANLAGFDMIMVDDIKECLTADTIVYRTGQNQYDNRVEITVEELYNIAHDTTMRGYLFRHKERGMKIRSYREGKILPGTVVDVKDNGVQPVWKVTLADGKTITSTANHRHMTKIGWKRVDKLKVGNRLLIDSNEPPQKPKAPMGKWKRTASVIAIDGHVRQGTYGHVTSLKKILKLLPNFCEWCGRDDIRLEAAHLDHDRHNNTRENVVRLCVLCHNGHDTPSRRNHNRPGRWGRGYRVDAVKIVSIEYAGEQQTYDLVMKDRGHNFVANGVITHNSIKHKKSTLMESLRPKFIKGCRDTNDIDEGVSEKIWADIEGYSGYSYNKSHAVAYSFTSYQTLKLKYLYPLEYHTALIRTVPYDDKERRQAYLVAAVRAGFKILPPDVNRGEIKAIPVPEKNAIMLGLVDFAGIGPKLGDRIVSNRPIKGYKKVSQVALACNNTKAMDVLTRGSALRCIGVEGEEGAPDELLSWNFTDHMKKWRKKYRSEVVLPEHDGDDCVIIGELIKADKRKTKKNTEYMTWQVRWSPTQTYTIRLWGGTERVWKCKPGSIVAVSGRYEQKWGNLSVGDPNRIEMIKSASRK